MTTYTYDITKNIKVNITGREIARKQTKHQLLIVLETKEFAKMLLIGTDEKDLCVQFSEKDEAYYHEAVVHPAMAGHENPKNILIIGGGDGGAAREVLKYNIDKITLVDIDDTVIEFSKQNFPEFKKALENPKVEIKIQDGRKYLKETNEKFDVIILDLTDPQGPAKALFTKEFYEQVKKHLKENGIMTAQTSSYFEPKVLGRVNTSLKEVFENVTSYSTFIPSFMVEETYTLAGKINTNIEKTLVERKIELKAYTPTQLQNRLNNKSQFVKKTLSKQWKPSTLEDPVDSYS